MYVGNYRLRPRKEKLVSYLLYHHNFFVNFTFKKESVVYPSYISEDKCSPAMDIAASFKIKTLFLFQTKMLHVIKCQA